MRMVTNRRSVIGKDVYVGIDVHKESWQVKAFADGPFSAGGIFDGWGGSRGVVRAGAYSGRM
ncbi:MAG: hypothetical protein ABSB94_16590 [Syntrophorhabdales bacterium]|jgi:hypothetical protein